MSILAFFFFFSWWILLLTIPSFWDKPTFHLPPGCNPEQWLLVGQHPASTALDQDPHCGAEGWDSPVMGRIAHSLGKEELLRFSPSLIQPSRAAKECQQVSHHNGKTCAEPSSWPWLLQVTQALWHLALSLFNLQICSPHRFPLEVPALPTALGQNAPWSRRKTEVALEAAGVGLKS